VSWSGPDKLAAFAQNARPHAVNSREEAMRKILAVVSVLSCFVAAALAQNFGNIKAE
jgi:hypothetical protein